MHHPTDRITHTTAFVTPVVEHWLEREMAQWVHPMKDWSDDPPHHEWMLYLWATVFGERVVEPVITNFLFFAQCIIAHTIWWLLCFKFSLRSKCPSGLNASLMCGQSEIIEPSVKRCWMCCTQNLKFLSLFFQSRKISLEDAIKLFSFYRECDEFEMWMKDKVSVFLITKYKK